MRIKFLFFLTLSVSVCHAQSDSIPKKQTTQYLGIQANELLRQIFNLSGNTTTIVNPYLVNYSINSNRSGWGLNLGVGYTIDNADLSDPNTTRKTQANNFSLRIGVERKVLLSKKWMLSYGLDLLTDKGNNKTTNKTQFQFNSSETDTDANTKDSGLGTRFTLNYFITSKIILGTEATYYYKAITTSQKVTNTFTNFDPNTGLTNTQTSTSDTTETLKQFRFAVPAILFLILKF